VLPFFSENMVKYAKHPLNLNSDSIFLFKFTKCKIVIRVCASLSCRRWAGHSSRHTTSHPSVAMPVAEDHGDRVGVRALRRQSRQRDTETCGVLTHLHGITKIRETTEFIARDRNRALAFLAT
jgi:hypothetical protein